MRSHAATPVLAGLLACLAGGAVADPAYRAEDIVSHFAGAPALGATRGLCIGTEAECSRAAAPAKPAATPGFDLVVRFDYNSDRLTDEARANLDQFARALRDPRLAAAAFVVEGHTDAKGSDPFNLDLSERRAQAVVRYLKDKGVSPARIVARGYGKQKPRASDPLDPSNRRVEARLSTR